MAPMAREEVTDEVLMLRFQAGDRAAFAGIVRRHKTAIYNFVLRMVRSGPAAEDLVQDVFVRIVQSAADFKYGSRFRTWAFAIARNVCVDHLRSMSLRRHPSFDQPRRADQDGPTLHDVTADDSRKAAVERAAIGLEMGPRIVRCVEDLPEVEREVFLLREIADLPFKDIATLVGVPEPTVKTRLRAALERLQEKLVDYEDYARALR